MVTKGFIAWEDIAVVLVKPDQNFARSKEWAYMQQVGKRRRQTLARLGISPRFISQKPDHVEPPRSFSVVQHDLINNYKQFHKVMLRDRCGKDCCLVQNVHARRLICVPAMSCLKGV